MDRNLLKESEGEFSDNFRILFENVNEAILIIQDDIIKVSNAKAAEIFGYTGEYLESRPFTEFIHTDDRKAAKKHLLEILKSSFSSNEFFLRFLHQDGAVGWIEIKTRFITKGDRPAILAFMSDVTAKKKADEETKLRTCRLKAIQKFIKRDGKYFSLLEAIPDPVTVHDMEGAILYLNPAFESLFGWTLEEIKQREIDIFVPSGKWDDTDEMFARLLDGNNVSNFESLRLTREGETIPVSINGAPYRDRENKHIGVIITLRDIREKKRLEEQFIQAQKMEALGNLAGGIAHNFNNLLTSIQGNASLMLLECGPSHPFKERLENIEQYAQDGADLTRQLLGFAKGKKHEVKPTDLNEIIKKHTRMFGRTRKEISIHRKYQKDIWTVEVDRGQIRQVLLNLFVNAADAMPGGGEIFIETENIVLDRAFTILYQAVPGKYVKISVRDTGSGMDETTRRRIFEPFFTTRERGKGTGLGLASVSGIIKKHGGIIDFQTQKNKGTTFNIYLPAKIENGEAGSMENINRHQMARGTETVLLIDDEAIILDVNSSMINALGYKVMTAKNGKDALMIYNKNMGKIDIVILDMIMPDMGGGEVYDKLKAANPDIKVILSSGYSVNGQANEILDRGCNAFIQKPFDMNTLSSKLRDILDSR